MNTIGLSQRIEELQLALAGMVESPKAPTVSAYQEGATTYLIRARGSSKRAGIRRSTRAVSRRSSSAMRRSTAMRRSKHPGGGSCRTA
ncbi:hypothetical protein Bphy_5362 [Paraburkholderia phymatum STM815]|uniref:Uncharacterized protein n=1 Tax=Paraburkholderia phymatum (strain DSM 17167 / CIP 108236 / LMG 21445 / STM815) TaxID=391038 RepID=B2JND8_PARP8|nr:hypothetical protein Bphy_5362 [Paraburkholderia phymatum STM815]